MQNMILTTARILSELIQAFVRREEHRLNLPPLWAGTKDPAFVFLLRIGPWKLTHTGLWQQYRRVSANGKLHNRDWKRIL